MINRIVLCMSVLLISLSQAFAIEAPKVPAGAKKLTGAEIIAAYDGNTYVFDNFTEKEPLTGKTTYDLKKKTTTGEWAMGKEGGKFKGKARIKGDQFCYTVGGQKEKCNFVYEDGPDIYEVDTKGVVTSKIHKE
jgi:hypothetical protein